MWTKAEIPFWEASGSGEIQFIPNSELQDLLGEQFRHKGQGRGLRQACTL